MDRIDKVVNEFLEGIKKLKNGKWQYDDSKIEEALNTGYKQGISDVLSMIEGEFKEELTGVTLHHLIELVAKEQCKICFKEWLHMPEFDDDTPKERRLRAEDRIQNAPLVSDTLNKQEE